MKYHEYVLLSAMESCPRGRRSMIGNHVGGKHCLRVRIPTRFIFTNWPRWSSERRHRPFTAVTGSSPVRAIYFNSNIPFGGLAQLGEHLPYKQGSRRSIPLTSITGWFRGGG